MTRSKKMGRTSHNFKIYFIVWGVCMCTFPVCLNMCIHERVCVCEDQRPTSTVFLNFLSPPYILRQGLSLILELSNSAKLTGRQTDSSQPPLPP